MNTYVRVLAMFVSGSAIFGEREIGRHSMRHKHGFKPNQNSGPHILRLRGRFDRIGRPQHVVRNEVTLGEGT